MNKRSKLQLDEMQLEKLYKIEEVGENICFFGLIAAILIQLLIGCTFRQIIGELIVFFALTVYTLVASLAEGIWSKSVAPTLKNNLLGGLIAAAAVGAFFAAKLFVFSRLAVSPARIRAIAIAMIIVFVLCFLPLELFRRLYQKRRDTLDHTGDSEE